MSAPDRVAAAGFYVFRDVVSQDRLATFAEQLFAEFDRAVVDGELFEGGGFLSGHLNCYPGEGARFVWDDLVEHGIVDIVRTIRPDIADKVRKRKVLRRGGASAPR